MCKSSNWMAVGFSRGPFFPTEHWICRKGRFNILYTLHAPNHLKKTAFFTLMNSPERKWECQWFLWRCQQYRASPSWTLTPGQAAALDREYVLLMISRFLAWKLCIVGWMKGSLFSLSHFSLSYLTSYTPSVVHSIVDTWVCLENCRTMSMNWWVFSPDCRGFVSGQDGV